MAKKERKENDAYTTPMVEVERFFRHRFTGARSPRRIIEPGAGGAPFLMAAKHYWPKSYCYASDIQKFPLALEVVFSGLGIDWEGEVDFINADYNSVELFDLVITNPPFNLAEEFLLKAIDIVDEDGTIIFLLRLSWLESQDRYPLFQKYYPTSIYIVPDRISFTNDGGTDKSAYAFYEWKPQFFGVNTSATLSHLTLSDKKLAKTRSRRKKQMKAKV